MWTKDMDAVLLRMWPTHSASQIAKRLGVTRNAVIGRNSRLERRYGDYVAPSRKLSRDQAEKNRSDQESVNKRLASEVLKKIASGEARDIAVVHAVTCGATQVSVAEALDLTRQRISQIVIAAR